MIAPHVVQDIPAEPDSIQTSGNNAREIKNANTSTIPSVIPTIVRVTTISTSKERGVDEI
jgi:hypothetical protein